MRRRLGLLAFLLIALVLFPRDAQARDDALAPSWGRYADPDSGLVFDFPNHIFTQKSNDERDGAVFSTADGRARLRVFAVANTANDTPRNYLRRIADPGSAKFTYVRTTRRFFVASGTRDGMIFYRRCNFSPRGGARASCFQLDYPQREKRAWDDVVTRISLSLRTAALE